MVTSAKRHATFVNQKEVTHQRERIVASHQLLCVCSTRFSWFDPACLAATTYHKAECLAQTGPVSQTGPVNIEHNVTRCYASARKCQMWGRQQSLVVGNVTESNNRVTVMKTSMIRSPRLYPVFHRSHDFPSASPVQKRFKTEDKNIKFVLEFSSQHRNSVD